MKKRPQTEFVVRRTQRKKQCEMNVALEDLHKTSDLLRSKGRWNWTALDCEIFSRNLKRAYVSVKAYGDSLCLPTRKDGRLAIMKERR